MPRKGEKKRIRNKKEKRESSTITIISHDKNTTGQFSFGGDEQARRVSVEWEGSHGFHRVQQLILEQEIEKRDENAERIAALKSARATLKDAHVRLESRAATLLRKALSMRSKGREAKARKMTAKAERMLERAQNKKERNKGTVADITNKIKELSMEQTRRKADVASQMRNSGRMPMGVNAGASATVVTGTARMREAAVRSSRVRGAVRKRTRVQMGNTRQIRLGNVHGNFTIGPSNASRRNDDSSPETSDDDDEDDEDDEYTDDDTFFDEDDDDE